MAAVTVDLLLHWCLAWLAVAFLSLSILTIRSVSCFRGRVADFCTACILILLGFPCVVLLHLWQDGLLSSW